MGVCRSLLFAGLLLATGNVHAQRVVFAALDGESDEASAATLIARGHLMGGQRPVVPRQEMLLALDRVSAAKRAGLAVEMAGAAALLKDLGADRLITGELIKDDTSLSLTLKSYDGSATLLAAQSVKASRGEVAALVLEGLKRIAADTGVDIADRPSVSLGELRPFVRAEQLLQQNNPKAAADALQVAIRSVAARAPGAKEVADQVWRDPKVPTDSRIGAALAAGETKEAVKLGEAQPPANSEVRAQTARAHLANAEPKKAEKDLAPLKKESGSDVLSLARAELAYQKGKKADAEAQLGPLLNKSPPNAAALAFVSGLPPNNLSKAMETLSMVAAQRVSKTHPGVASSIGVRAAKGGTATPDAIGLVSVDDMANPDLDAIDKMLEGQSTPLGKTLQSDLQQRKAGAKPVELKGTPGGGARVVEKGGKAGAGPAKVAKKKLVGAATPEVQEIAKMMGPLLDAFPAFLERRPGTVVVYPFSNSGAPPWSLWNLNQTVLRFALLHALESAPYDYGVVDGSRPVGELSHEQLAKLAKTPGASGDFILLYRFTIAHSQPHVSLSLYDAAAAELLEYEDDVPARSVLKLNLAIIPAAGALVIALLAWIFWTMVRVGELHVEIKRDPGAEQEAMILLLSKKPKPPSIVDAQDFHKKHLSQGPKRQRLKLIMAPLRSEFPRVPVGTWYLHLYGTHVKGGEVRTLPETLTQKVVIKKGESASAKIDVDPNATEYRIRVLDGDPIKGAMVWLDDLKTAMVLTDSQGHATLMLPRGDHVVCCEVKDELFKRQVHAIGGKVQVLNFDLVRERREAQLASGLELAQDPDDPGMAQTQSPVSVAAAPAAKKPSEPEDDGISLPEGFGAIPVPTQVESPTQTPAHTVAGVASAKLGRSETPAGQGAPVGMRRYKRVTELGRGAMGVVYRGRDVVLERDVAIKMISEEVRANPQALELFFQEAKAMAALNHPNLVTVYDQGSDGGETFLVMEYIEGKTLESLITERGGALPLDECMNVTEQIAAGLAYAHGKRILHRDIKPANIFLTKDGTVKIGDFGLARAVRQARLTQTKVCGTPLYMSPEQIRGTDVDFRSDLYSVGCTLFELLTGRPPFVTGEVMYHHMYTAPPKPSEINPKIPKDVDSLVMSCLEKDIGARVESADKLRGQVRPLKSRFS
jgi:predicted Ser/Thr protein kinase